MKFKTFLSVLVVMVSVVVNSSVVAQVERSQPTLPGHPACEQEVYDTMQARAWLEGQREIETAELLILRPDSVLEYSCFDVRTGQLGVAANTMFSDNVASPALFNNPPATFTPDPDPHPFLPTFNQDRVMSPVAGDPFNRPFNHRGIIEFGANPPPQGQRTISGKLDNVLSELVFTSLAEFVGQNFGHRFASNGAIAAGSQPCSAMDVVWDFLKCVNINRNNFFQFQQLVLRDPRTQPIACNDPGRAGLWQGNLNNSVVTLTSAFPNRPVLVEPVVDAAAGTDNLHADLLDAAGGNCAQPPIQTGAVVHRIVNGVSEANVPDALCITPGCYYDGSGACTAN